MQNNFKNRSSVIFALITVLLMFFAVEAQSATRATATPRIRGFDVEQVDQLAPGTELNFTLYGTPGGTATASIAGTNTRFVLSEVEVGVYEGSYTVRKKDKLAPDSRVTTNLRIGNKVATAVLDERLSTEPLASAHSNDGVTPKIDSFDVRPSNDLNPGSNLHFVLTGTPGAAATVRIAGIKGRISLDEVRRGVYEGSYPISRRDTIDPYAAVTGNLRLGNHAVSTTLSQPLLSGEPQTRPASRANRHCANCGVVESTRVIQVAGEGGYLGLIGGGLAGALVGSQIGSGKGTTLAEIAGAAGGAYAGRQIEKNVRKTNQYEVVVRLQDGGTQTFTYQSDPRFRNGERVRVENGTLVLDR